ncbi:MAG: hypothetical protein ACXAEN_08255 [Candidatus Thorarchaeota archaeon]|jgi:hypothetical protein
MARGHILGSRPARDPVEEIQDSRVGVTGDNELRWQDREAKRPWTLVAFSTLLSIVSVFLTPWAVTAYCLAMGIVLIALSSSYNPRDAQAMRSSEWCVLGQPDLLLTKGKKSIEIRGTGVSRHIAGLYLKKASNNLSGKLGRLIRAVDSSNGLCLVITLQREDPKRLLESDIVISRLEKYFNRFLGPKGVKSYVSSRGGLWRTSFTLLGHSRTEVELKSLISAIRGSIVEKKIKRLPAATIMNRISSYTAPLAAPAFNASGFELADWLVQLASELSSEVGSNIPGEFVAPIRPKSVEYPLGVVIDPETLRPGPLTGLTHSDIVGGLLICGGEWEERFNVNSLMVESFLGQKKRVIVISGKREVSLLAGLHEDAIVFKLGSDFVLNPVDCEGTPRLAYVSKLKSALQGMTGPLRMLDAASDLEKGLARAVALPNATLADVKFILEGDETAEQSSPSIDSVRGMDAIRTLHQGSAARAFYGIQTASMEKLSDFPLTIISVDLGGSPIEMFAWDVFCIKLGGLAKDPNLVVLLDDPMNLVIDNKRNDRRQPWVERMVSDLRYRGPLMVSIRHPSQLGVVADSFNCCVSLALRHIGDIKVVSDLLGLSVIGGSMHSKARLSARESAYLRTLEKRQALLVDGPAETCYPIRLDSPSDLEAPTYEELQDRIRRSIEPAVVTSVPSENGTILDTVSGKNRDLATAILTLLKQYEPLTDESVRKFVETKGQSSEDVEAVLLQLEEASMILRGHEYHGGVSYTNWRVTMKGDMALKQAAVEGA